MTTLMNMKIGSQGNTNFSFLRTALMAASFVCPQDHVKDGFARLVKKTVMTSLCQSKKLPNIIAAEAIMDSSWQTILGKVRSGEIAQNRGYQLFGKLQHRIALFLIGKGELGIEQKE